MNDSPRASAQPEDPSSLALANALPKIRTAKTQGWIAVVAIGVVSVALAFVLSGTVQEPGGWVIVTLVGGFAGIGAMFSWTRSKHETAVMPIIAQAFGLRYEKAPKGLYESLPRNFIPLGGRRSVDDMMEGRIADRRFRFAECKTETGGKNSSTLFKGIVLEVQSAGTLPSFLIASEKETRGFLFFKGHVQVDDMTLVHQSTGYDGQTYGLWSHSGAPGQMAGLRAFMDRIIDLGPSVLGSSSLYSLVSTGGNYLVSLRHSRDMFRIGGLLTDETEVMQDIRNASQEFAHPVQLVSEILKAEQALLAT